MINILRSVAVLGFVGLFLAACEEAPQQGSLSGSSTTTAVQASESSGSGQETVVKVWPPVPETVVSIDPNLLRLNIMVVYDGSGSMDYSSCGSNSPNRHADASKAVKSFIDAVPSEANVGLYVFDGIGKRIVVPLGVNNHDELKGAIDNVNVNQGTPLKTAITDSYYALEAQAQRQLGYGRYVLLVVTDGEASSGQDPTRAVNYIIDETPVEVHTIGLCFSGKHSLNQKGRTFYTDAQNPDQIIAGLKDALVEATEDEVTFE